MIKQFDFKYYLEDIRIEIEKKFDSVSKFSRETGISRENITRILNGKHNMSLGVYIRLIVALDYVKLEDVWDVTEEELKALNSVPVEYFFKVHGTKIMTTIINLIR